MEPTIKIVPKLHRQNDTNGYKDVWNTSGSGNGGSGQNNSVPVRPSACTPDSRVGGYLDTTGGSPASRGGGGGSAAGVTGSAWNSSQCSITGATNQAAAAAAAATGLHQASNHTFYPWMAIAGMCSIRQKMKILATILFFLQWLSRNVETNKEERRILCEEFEC